MIARDALWRPSPNCAERTQPVDMIVLHYTGMVSLGAAARWLADPASRVSAHYLIAADGTMIAMVDEAREAWHAGRSVWRGIRRNNARSIGIELASRGHDPAPPTFPAVQVDRLLRLLDEVRTRWACPPNNVVAHSDIAPHRKADPGERFPWERLVAAGHAIAVKDGSPAPAPSDLSPSSVPDADRLAEALGRIGYGVGTEIGDDLVIRAFHRRHRPGRVGQRADACTLRIAERLASSLPPASRP